MARQSIWQTCWPELLREIVDGNESELPLARSKLTIARGKPTLASGKLPQAVGKLTLGDVTLARPPDKGDIVYGNVIPASRIGISARVSLLSSWSRVPQPRKSGLLRIASDFPIWCYTLLRWLGVPRGVSCGSLSRVGVLVCGAGFQKCRFGRVMPGCWRILFRYDGLRRSRRNRGARGPGFGESRHTGSGRGDAVTGNASYVLEPLDTPNTRAHTWRSEGRPNAPRRR